ncbi:hypothetical protein KAR91_55915 [Candidatus Pacearchaeota archaeon]|nr:hypothetical protein [Candidatus Pacearchaeota archaeon]
MKWKSTQEHPVKKESLVKIKELIDSLPQQIEETRRKIKNEPVQRA